MDYPHPLAEMGSNGEIDLANAYDDKIGAWDKVSITWGYSDFAKGTPTADTLNNILAKAYKSGLRFLTDQDARPAGSASAYAHLWDNGADVIDGLKDAMKVRAKALQQFGENNIQPGMPMAMLEDVLVPVYFYHRYQVEAVTKLVGGLNYTYALRGDWQTSTTPVEKAVQEKALSAVMACLDPQFLSLPPKVVAAIPPRPAGYIDSRELFNKRTGLTFDALAPAETAADMPLSFLFNPERVKPHGAVQCRRRTECRRNDSGIDRQNMESAAPNRHGKVDTATNGTGAAYLPAKPEREYQSQLWRAGGGGKRHQPAGKLYQSPAKSKYRCFLFGTFGAGAQ